MPRMSPDEHAWTYLDNRPGTSSASTAAMLVTGAGALLAVCWRPWVSGGGELGPWWRRGEAPGHAPHVLAGLVPCRRPHGVSPPAYRSPPRPSQGRGHPG